MTDEGRVGTSGDLGLRSLLLSRRILLSIDLEWHIGNYLLLSRHKQQKPTYSVSISFVFLCFLNKNAELDSHSMSKIEAELEAELERLELNITASSIKGKTSALDEVFIKFSHFSINILME
jgi:hypothetical protein